MDWQQICSLAVVTVTALLLARSLLARRTSRRSTHCGTTCSCAFSPPPGTDAGTQALPGTGSHAAGPDEFRTLESPLKKR